MAAAIEAATGMWRGAAASAPRWGVRRRFWILGAQVYGATRPGLSKVGPLGRGSGNQPQPAAHFVGAEAAFELQAFLGALENLLKFLAAAENEIFEVFFAEFNRDWLGTVGVLEGANSYCDHFIFGRCRRSQVS